MPVIPTPVAGERESLLEYLRYHHAVFVAVSDGLTDEQARSTPTISTLSIGGLIKHVTVVEHAWTQQVAVAPEQLVNDPWSLEGMMSHREEQHVMHDDTKAEDVGLVVNRQPASLFGRHVLRRADDHAGAGL